MMFLDFVNNCDSVEDSKALMKLLQQCLLGHGIDHFAFTYYQRYPNSNNPLRFEYASKAYKRWHDYYLQSDFIDCDPTMSEIYQSTVPVYWEVEQQLQQATSDRVKNMRKIAKQCNLKRGLCIPVHGPHEDFAIMVLAESHQQNCLDSWQSKQNDFISTAIFTYRSLKNCLAKHITFDIDVHLTQRQRQCLALVAEKHSVQQIAKKLGIRPRTVNFHIQTANKLLGTDNKYQSIAKLKEKQST